MKTSESYLFNQRQLTLGQLMAHAKRWSQLRNDIVCTPDGFHASTAGWVDIAAGEELLPCNDGDYEWRQQWAPVLMTRHAMRQMHEYTGTPHGFMTELANSDSLDERSLYSQIINVRKEGKTPRLFRMMQHPENEALVHLRAVLSDSYMVFDNIDALGCVLTGASHVMSADETRITHCEMDDSFMRLRINVPEIQMLVPDLVGDYRSPFSGRSGSDLPVMFAGVEIRNSEIGAGAFSVQPLVVVQVCSNGLTISKEAYRRQHRGARIDVGASPRTVEAVKELIVSETIDAIRKFTSISFLEEQVAVLRNLKNGGEVALSNLQVVAGNMFKASEVTAIVDAWVKGGDHTRLGVMQAVTAVSQTLPTVERAMFLDDNALELATHVHAS